MNKNFTVWRDNNVEIVKEAEFGTLEEAKAYCDGETAGRNEVDDRDNDYEGRSTNFRMEVYEGDPIEFAYDDNGDVDDDKTIYKEPVYTTKQYYCD